MFFMVRLLLAFTDSVVYIIFKTSPPPKKKKKKVRYVLELIFRVLFRGLGEITDFRGEDEFARKKYEK